MLAITRTNGEGVTVFPNGSNKPIHITIVHTSGDKTRMAFDAPKDIVILRDELIPEKKDIPF
jgi:carbon storage regulator CsrA